MGTQFSSSFTMGGGPSEGSRREEDNDTRQREGDTIVPRGWVGESIVKEGKWNLSVGLTRGKSTLPSSVQIKNLGTIMDCIPELMSVEVNQIS